MAAASFGIMEKEGLIVGEVSGKALELDSEETVTFKNGHTPQEGTKEHMNVVERHLDELTFCGSAVNDIELQLSSVRATYRRTLAECKSTLEDTRRRLGACIPKSQPFIEVWRRARQIQEESNKAAARFDKASSQYAAAKEMIRLTESELANQLAESTSCDRSHDSNHALLEVLNHATTKVVETEKEKRESEVEHRKVMERCNAVLDEYRTIERKLRPHIVKSRPYYEERWRSSQRLNELKGKINDLEKQLKSTKQRYAETLRDLGHLNHSIHRQRRANSLTPVPKQCDQTTGGGSDSESVQSWQLTENGVQFTGSTGSLPSIGSSINDDIIDEKPCHSTSKPTNMATSTPVINIIDTHSLSQLARDIVQHTITTALARLQQEQQQ